MKNKKYVAPQMEVCIVNVEMIASSASTTMGKSSDSPIMGADEILTKERSIMGENESLWDNVW